MESTMLLLYYTAAAGLDVFLSFCEMVLLHEIRYSKIKWKKFEKVAWI
jgi:hypothetical protein